MQKYWKDSYSAFAAGFLVCSFFLWASYGHYIIGVIFLVLGVGNIYLGVKGARQGKYFKDSMANKKKQEKFAESVAKTEEELRAKEPEKTIKTLTMPNGDKVIMYDDVSLDLPPIDWNPEDGKPPIGLWVHLIDHDDDVEVMVYGAGTIFCGRDIDGYIGIFDSNKCEPINPNGAATTKSARR